MVFQKMQHVVLNIGQIVVNGWKIVITSYSIHYTKLYEVVVDRESTMLGGAGNVARNLASLGARVEVVTVVGDDAAAEELARLMSGWKIVITSYSIHYTKLYDRSL